MNENAMMFRDGTVELNVENCSYLCRNIMLKHNGGTMETFSNHYFEHPQRGILFVGGMVVDMYFTDCTLVARLSGDPDFFVMQTSFRVNGLLN